MNEQSASAGRGGRNALAGQNCARAGRGGRFASAGRGSDGLVNAFRFVSEGCGSRGPPGCLVDVLPRSPRSQADHEGIGGRTLAGRGGGRLPGRCQSRGDMLTGRSIVIPQINQSAIDALAGQTCARAGRGGRLASAGQGRDGSAYAFRSVSEGRGGRGPPGCLVNAYATPRSQADHEGIGGRTLAGRGGGRLPGCCQSRGDTLTGRSIVIPQINQTAIDALACQTCARAGRGGRLASAGRGRDGSAYAFRSVSEGRGGRGPRGCLVDATPCSLSHHEGIEGRTFAGRGGGCLPGRGGGCLPGRCQGRGDRLMGQSIVIPQINQTAIDQTSRSPTAASAKKGKRPTCHCQACAKRDNGEVEMGWAASDAKKCLPELFAATAITTTGQMALEKSMTTTKPSFINTSMRISGIT